MTAIVAPTRIAETYRNADQSLLWIGNFEVEQLWAAGDTALPRLSSRAGTALVSRMDEFALWLAEDRDTVLVKAAPDRAFVDYVSAVTGARPRIISLDRGDHDGLVSELALVALGAGDHLPVDTGSGLVAHGFSQVESDLAGALGIATAGPDTSAVRGVNSKVFSRRLADDLGIRQPAGLACTDADSWSAGMAYAHELLTRGAVVIKEAFGVSGKGLAVVDSPDRLARLARRVERAARANQDRFDFCVEQWVDKDQDFNYQFTIARDGQVRFDFVKQAVTRKGVHSGHVMPAGLTPRQLDEIRSTADAVGQALFAHGYWGVVGIDALTVTDGTLHPLIEINARFNMSTYQLPAQAAFGAQEGPALARHYELRTKGPMTFDEVAGRLGPLLARPGDDEGVVVLNHATLNAAHAVTEPGQEAAGRLYVLIVSPDPERLVSLDTAAALALGLEPVHTPEGSDLP
ncbi:ATP-grasp domain-containing protein [Granulicoccus sp. GXG6511]|uniref:preATP grasp domain-containing protein n=1 Tax=Granulicoccus sp. GXG6511 TaxID=3381351 RepID=UPI003D7D4024